MVASLIHNIFCLNMREQLPRDETINSSVNHVLLGRRIFAKNLTIDISRLE